MLDWLWSKLTILFATVVLLSSVSAYFISERDQSVHEELRIVGRSLASFIDTVLGLPGTARFTVGSDHDADLALPRDIGGRPFRIELRRDSVILEMNSRTVIDHWSGDLRFWRWDGASLDAAFVRNRDESSPSLTLASGRTFQISLEEVLLGNVTVLMAFAVCPA